MPRIIRPLSPNPRIKNDDDATVARYGDLEWLYSYITQQGGGGGGTSAITWKGTWSAATAYVKDDAVYYDGSSYICTTAVGPSASNPSVDVANWDVLALEGQQGAAGPAGAAGNAGPAGSIGPVGIAYRGGWSALANYAQRDVVVYNGSAYICTVAINASANNPTVAIANWDLLVSKGAQGSPGLPGIPGPIGPVGPAGLNWQGAWSALGTYVVDDAVGYNGASWFCINPVGPSATPPNLDTVNWSLLAAQGAQGNQGIQGLQGDPGDPGPQGPAGPPNTLVIGTVTSAASPSATITGTAPNQTLNLVLAKGDQGDPGPPGPAGSGSVVAGNAVYVSKSGNDSTGVRNNLGLSFLTINAALAAAQTGDTVVVFPGTYEMTEGLVLRDGINFDFLGTGLVQVLAGVNNYIFDDIKFRGTWSNLTAYAVNDSVFYSTSTPGLAVLYYCIAPITGGATPNLNSTNWSTNPPATPITSIINAPGWTFEGRGFTGNDVNFPIAYRGSFRGVLKLSKASNVKFVADKLIADDAVVLLNGRMGTAVLPNYAGSIVPILDITANLIRKKALAKATFTCIGGQFGQLTANVKDVILDVSGIDDGPIFYECFQKCSVTADRVLNNDPSGFGLCIYVDGTVETDQGYFNINLLRSGDGWCFWVENGGYTAYGGKFHADIKRIECASDCIVVCTYADLVLQGTTIVSTTSNFTDGIVHCEFGGSLTLVNCIIERTNPGVDGADLLATLPEGKIQVVNTVFALDRTKPFNAINYGPAAQCSIKSWNGTYYSEVPFIHTDTQAPAFTDFTGSDIQRGSIYLKNYIGCSILNSKVIDSSLYFTGNGDTISNIVMTNDVVISPPPIQTVNYGVTTNLTTKPVNLIVGAAGTGPTTVNLPTSASFTFGYTTNTQIFVSAMTSGTIQLGHELIGPNVPSGTIIVGFLGGATGGTGNYAVSKRFTGAGPFPSSPGRSAVVKGNKFIVSDVGGGASSITVNAGVGANIAASSVSGTYTLVGGETATFTLVESSTAFLWKKE